MTTAQKFRGAIPETRVLPSWCYERPEPMWRGDDRLPDPDLERHELIEGIGEAIGSRRDPKEALR